MTPAKAAAILDSWGKNAKSDEARKVCEMAAIGMRNAAATRQILDKSGQHEVTIQCLRDDNGVEMFIVSLRLGPVIMAGTLSEALTGLLESVEKKAPAS